MALIKSNVALNRIPPVMPVAQENVTSRVAMALKAGDSIATNVLAMCVLPAGCILLGYIVNAGKVDSNATPLVTFDLGVVNAAGTAISTAAVDGGAKWLAGSTLAQNGGIVLSTATKAAADVVSAVVPTDYDRSIGIAFAASSATGQAGSIELTLEFKAA